jgi:hypothetical protein
MRDVVPIQMSSAAKLAEVHKITDEEFWECWASSEEFWESLAVVAARENETRRRARKAAQSAAGGIPTKAAPLVTAAAI